ncbi:MAG TPA: peptidylprolyl isomerase [Rhizomicrobium sp.]|nr:peptidylprolyl isomerase [Rhizomicrobium sp.]
MRKLFLALAIAMLPFSASAQDVSAAPDQPAPAQPAAEPAAPQPAGPLATIQTSMGSFVIALDPVHAPLTVANFIRYAKAKHFDGTVIYRIAPNFVIQMGSYDAKGNYRPTRKPIPLEANNGLSNVRGAVAMARDDPPASAVAEFFIDMSDNSAALDHDPKDTGNTTGYAVFGHVVSGMAVLDKINDVPLGGTGPMPASAPKTPITIEKITIAP